MGIAGFSLFVHSLVLGIGMVVPTPPQYFVTRAPSSIDIVIVPDEPVPPVVEAPKPEIIMEAVNPVEEKIFVPPQSETVAVETPPVAEKKSEQPVEEKHEEVHTETLRGAEIEKQLAALYNPAPQYPYTAQRRGWEGVVLIKALVAEDGFPSEVIVDKTSGHDILDQAAVRAVKQWRFKPAQRGLMKFSSWVEIPIRFKLIEE